MNGTSRVVVHPSRRDEKHNITLVVPSYSEGIGILDTLYTAAIESERVDSKVAVFVVVNNPSECDETLLSENKLTAKLVIDIIRGKELGHKKESGYYYAERKKIERIRNSGITVGIVDCYSERNAPEVCNIGYARDVGTRSILDFLEDDTSIIAHTDADCKLLRGYFQRMKQSYGGKAIDVQISRGKVDFVFEKGQEELEDQVSWVERFEYFMQIFTKGDELDFPDEKLSSEYTPGSHHQYTKGLFNQIGGYEKIGGAEDVTFGMKAQQLGHTIYGISSRISTLCRFSDRTEEGHGFGFEIIRRGSSTLPNTPTNTIEYLGAKSQCEKILEECHQSENFGESLRKSPLNEIFPGNIVNEIIRIYEEYSWSEGMKDFRITGILPSLMALVRNELKKIYPRNKLHKVAKDAMKKIEEDPVLNHFAEQLDVPHISMVKVELESEDDETLEAYCEFASKKLHSYNLLKRAFSFIPTFQLAFEDLQKKIQENDIVLDESVGDIKIIYVQTINFIRKYWQKITLNLLAETIKGESLDKIVQSIESVYDNDEYIRTIKKLNDTFKELNKTHDCVFPDMSFYFNMQAFRRIYHIND